MKKLFTLFAALLTVSMTFAQHGAMVFAGKATFSVLDTEVKSISDTLVVELGNAKLGTMDKITLPDMVYKENMTIRSFTIDSLSYSQVGTYPNMYFEWTADSFSATATDNGVEKQVTGTYLKAQYDHTQNKFVLTAIFKYGSMPFPVTFNMEAAYYVKPVDMAINVFVGTGSYVATVGDTYKMRRYVDGDTAKLDVQLPPYSLSGIPNMGDMYVGSYTVQGLTYSEEMGGYYKEYSSDSLTVHINAENNGVTSMDNDYILAAAGTTLFVQYNGSKIAYVENNFKPGKMLMSITTVSGTKITSIDTVEGQEPTVNVQPSKVIENGRLVIIKDGRRYNTAGQRL